jgi:hypothetical protein
MAKWSVAASEGRREFENQPSRRVGTIRLYTQSWPKRAWQSMRLLLFNHKIVIGLRRREPSLDFLGA